MKVLVYVFHPHLDRSRIHKQWSEALRESPDLTLLFPYQEYPDWTFDIAKEQARLSTHDRIVFQFPLYWYSCPPLMKKWMDDVLTYNWAYGPEGKALKDKEWLIATSTGGPQDSYIAGGYNHYSMSELLKPFQQTAHLVQAKYLPYFVLHNALRVTDEALIESTEQYKQYIKDPELNPAVRLTRLSAELKNKNISL